MVKLILEVPRGFDAEKFCNVVTAIARDNYTTRAGITDLNDFDTVDFDLGNFANYNIDSGNFEIDASLIDFQLVNIIVDLQTLMPQVQFYFDGDGSKNNFETIYDNAYFDEALETLYANH